ncbi:23S rRNA (adenine(2030)-N(6))-methyltransferase RlmJ [Methyloterricola oryzae]|uniref:23S rRNA (adenine(2030)-N(6))-methyltransferase RlmJ n=1 Tax=Methyloterricola oryzae TaxID=1495050 RepID=UPI0005EB0027|nr:23S rRNA (adenine(2030)-N(6))-methyltransferase RlmJ [Methyloterricola oryzae]
MLSYRHAYHAGNHADVLKHVTLTLLFKALLLKEKPVCYLDTHAGAGRYALDSEKARKNREYETGIARLWQRTDLPAGVSDYVEAVRAFNVDGVLRIYPGSPRLVRHWLRPADRMLLCELHTKENAVLGDEFKGDRQVLVKAMDGYQALKALLPPKERRGLVLIDPAFELKDERNRLLQALQEAWKRWPTGTYAIWYPIQDLATLDWFHRQLKRSGIRKMLAAELRLFSEDLPLRMNGSSMVVINPPWHLEEQLTALGPWLHGALASGGEGGFRLQWLAGE